MKSQQYTPRILFLLFALFLFKCLLLAISPLDLAPDEAYYWYWSTDLDCAYVSKGPMIAWLIRGSTALLGKSEFAVRFPVLLCSLLFQIAFFYLGRLMASERVAYLLTIVLLLMPFFAVLGLGATTDAPALAFLMLALIFCERLYHRPTVGRAFFAAVLFGLSIYAKYTSALVPVLFALTLFATLEGARKWRILTVFFLSMSAMMLPILLWNYQHGWVNVLHNTGHVTSSKVSFIHIKYFFELIGSQLLLVGPFFVLAIFGITKRHYRDNLQSQMPRLFFLTAAVLAAICIVVSLRRPVYANWPMPLYPLLLLALSAVLADSRDEDVIKQALKRSYWLHLPIFLVSICLVNGFTFGLNPARLPLKKIMGWEELGRSIQRLTQNSSPSNMFLISDRIDVCSEIAFYGALDYSMSCANTDNRRLSQYDIWQDWQMQKRKNALIVLTKSEVPLSLKEHFEEVQSIASPLVIKSGEKEVRTFYFFLGKVYDGQSTPAPEHV